MNNQQRLMIAAVVGAAADPAVLRIELLPVPLMAFLLLNV